ncbi:MAG: anaerobic glycerol-3-phosphate dehydrogenase subunit A [Bacteroidales bacterium]|nr:anaerobic glycerol-3-phosphate dehydrogenase subunit A [Bacteroidales bacterium]
MNNEYDVIIIGGGITGAGTARDCALRGLRVLLVERGDIADGATGRNHGLLHSGARYAVKDGESARECIAENRILRRIAPHCVEDTQGLFITLPEDEEAGYGLDYQQRFIQACRDAGISAEAMDPREAVRLEPSVNPRLIGAVKVPDGSVDPFKLCAANILDARLHGADILTYAEVQSLILEGSAVRGIRVRKRRSGETAEYRARVTVNAAGIWGQAIVRMAGAQISMFPAKGALLVFAHRVNHVVINRCRKSADGDILVPGDTVTVIGTTSTKIPFEDCDDLNVTPDEVALLLREGSQLCPTLASTRILRAYAGVRPLVAADNDPSGRNISRGIVCLDHATRDGIESFVTITGGKLMTYRLMAQMATDAVCDKLGVSEPCTTHTALLPPTVDNAFTAGTPDGELVCECENVTMGQIRSAIRNFDIHSLADLRRRTRVGMGTCQGTYCVRKAAAALAEAQGSPADARPLAEEYLGERWKGMMPVGWGDTLREMEFMQRVFKAGAPSTFK